MYPGLSRGCLLGPGLDVCVLGALVRVRAEAGGHGMGSRVPGLGRQPRERETDLCEEPASACRISPSEQPCEAGVTSPLGLKKL